MSFGAEVKDFIRAFAVGSKIQNERKRTEIIDRIHSPEMQKLEMDYKRAQIQAKLHPANADVQRAAYLARANYYDYLTKHKGAADADLADQRRAAARASNARAAKDEYELNQWQNPTPLGGGAEDYGGAVPTPYATGGLVDDNDNDVASEPDMDADEAGAGSAIPAAAPAAAPAKTGGLPYDPKVAKEAAKAGLMYAQQATGAEGPGAVNTMEMSAASQGRTSYLRGAGAVEAREFNALRSLIAKKNPQLTEGQINLAALAKGYEYFSGRGDPEAAKRYAGSMVQTMRTMFDRYNALAKVAAQNGDVNAATMAIMKAYANVPDGDYIKLERTPKGIGFKVMTDSGDGNVIEKSKGIASPDQILNFITRGGMQDFDSLLKATQDKDTMKTYGAEAPKPPKVSDRKTAVELVQNAWPTDVQMSDREASSLQSAAQSIVLSGSSPEDATSAVLGFTSVDPSNPEGKPGFDVSRGKDGSGQILFRNGTKVTVPKDAFETMIRMRGHKIIAAKKKAAENKASDEKWNAQVGNVKDKVGGAANWMWENLKRGVTPPEERQGIPLQ